jgi:hypothetical protein
MSQEQRSKSEEVQRQIAYEKDMPERVRANNRRRETAQDFRTEIMRQAFANSKVAV